MTYPTKVDMTDTEFVLTSTLCGLDAEGKQKAAGVLKTSLLLPDSYREIQTIKNIHAVIEDKQILLSERTVLFEGKLNLMLEYESGDSSTQEKYRTFIPFSFYGCDIEPHKEPDAIRAEFFPEYLKLVLKSPRLIFVESGICVFYE